jgi:drug/metabolite transporter (DMT)-like permease
MKKQKILAQLSMVVTTMIWGITFVMVKDALNDAPPYMFAALRFGIAFILGLVYVNKGIKNITDVEMLGGLFCGFCLFVGYAFQNFGLMETTPSRSAFITSVSVILVPLILVLFRMKRVNTRIWIAVVLAIVGLYILLNPTGGGVNIGDILTFGCAVSFAAHVIMQDKYLSKGASISKLFLIQIMFVTIFSCASVFIFEDMIINISERLIIALLVTGILATFVAIMFMVWAQTILGPNQTAILLSLEPVFAALFSTFFAGEILGIYGWIGGMIVVLGVISSEVSFKKK